MTIEKNKENINFHGTPANLEEIKRWGGILHPKPSKTVTGAEGTFVFSAKNPQLAKTFALGKKEGLNENFYNLCEDVPGMLVPGILYVGYNPSKLLRESASVLHLSSRFFRPVGETGEYVSVQSVPIKGHSTINKLSAMREGGVQIFYMDPDYYQKTFKGKEEYVELWFDMSYVKWLGQLERDANKDETLRSEFHEMKRENVTFRKFLNEFVNKGIIRHLNSECLRAGKCVYSI